MEDRDNASEPAESSDQVRPLRSEFSDSISLSISDNFSVGSSVELSSEDECMRANTVFQTVQSNSSMNKALENELNIEHVCLGKSHGLAIINVMDQNRLFVWGNNEDYQLGLPKESGASPSLKVIPENVELERIFPLNIASKDDMSFLVGEVLTNKDLNPGNICNNQYDDEFCLECGRSYAFSLTERQLRDRVSTCAICQDDPDFHPMHLGHKLFSWGNNCFNRLGYSNQRLKIQKIPREVHPSLRVIKVSLAKQFAVCIDLVGRAFAWGMGIDHRLGSGIGGSAALGQKQSRESSALISPKREGSFLKSPFKSAKRTKKLDQIDRKKLEEDSFERQFSRKVSFVELQSKSHNPVRSETRESAKGLVRRDPAHSASNRPDPSIIFELNKIYREDFSVHSEDGFVRVEKRLFFENIICSKNGFILIVRSEAKDSEEPGRAKEGSQGLPTEDPLIQFRQAPEPQNGYLKKRRTSQESAFQMKFGKTVSNMSFDYQQGSTGSNVKLEMVVFGDNLHQELLVGFDDQVSQLVLIETPGFDSRVVDIQAGDHHFVALTKKGTVFAWGDNRQGQCGVGGYDIGLEVGDGPSHADHPHFLALSDEKQLGTLQRAPDRSFQQQISIQKELEQNLANEKDLEKELISQSDRTDQKSEDFSEKRQLQESEEDSESDMAEINMLLTLNRLIDKPGSFGAEEVAELEQSIWGFEYYSIPLRNTLNRMLKKIVENQKVQK